MLATAGLAVVTTLLGAIVSGRFQERAAERQVRATDGEAIRRDRLEAATALACATSDPRTAMWMRGDAILKGVNTDQIEALRSRSHTTRSAGTRPLVALRVLIADQTVRAPTDRMITLTYAIRDEHTTTEDLTAAARPRRPPTTTSSTPPPATCAKRAAAPPSSRRAPEDPSLPPLRPHPGTLTTEDQAVIGQFRAMLAAVQPIALDARPRTGHRRTDQALHGTRPSPIWRQPHP
ncbi:hypothetical protein [Streptomyces albogriseolus]|uniref:hypothetical protein n=1 Tax=Streptomyces albogriseolus TaxID=1887 RepID=UPI0034612DE8